MSHFPISIRVLILPKFEAGHLEDDEPGEAKYYYDRYCRGGERYQVQGCPEPLYVKDGIALIVTGMGKVNAAATLSCVLTDPRFDFSKAFFLSTGCGGAAAQRCVMGDVILVTSTLDFEFGHTVDARELQDPEGLSWFPDPSMDPFASIRLNEDLTERIWNLVRTIRPVTTPKTRAAMARTFAKAPWAMRDPMVLKGTAATSDNYWKGPHLQKNAERMAEHYRCPDPYMISEMEDHAVAAVLQRFHLLDRLAIIRGATNMDVFMDGSTAEQHWEIGKHETIVSEESREAVDIFFPAMKNIFSVGKVIIDAALEGKLD